MTAPPSTAAPALFTAANAADTAARGDESFVRRHGRSLVSAMYGALRAIKLYPLENQAVQNAMAELESCGAAFLIREAELELRGGGEYLFVNGVRLRLELDNYASFTRILALLAAHRIGAVVVGSTVVRRDWLVLLSSMQDVPQPEAEDPVGDLQERLHVAGITSIELAPLPRRADHGPESHKASAKRTYAHGVAAARDVITSVRMGRAAGVRRLKRAVQSLVDQLLSDEGSLVGLTTLRDFDEYTFSHCVNVCIFSIALGKRLGLTKVQLYDLGMGALLHDIGKSRLPCEVINKPGALTREEWALIAAHPWLGMLAMFNLRGQQDLPYRSMLIACEHHMKCDTSGYPRVLRPRTITLYSRIVAVVDSFDAATSRRSYQSTPWTPAEVLREMRDNVERGLDPVLVKAFINVLGIFPIGTVVILDTFELGIVHAPNPNLEELARPLVRIVSDASANLVYPGEIVDLTVCDAAGAPLRTIVQTVDPDLYGIRVSDYFV